MNRYMLIIDAQNDFCDVKGSLYVPNANVDMYNLAQLVDRVGNSIERIIVTLDNHRVMHIAHPLFWVDKNNEHPNPYTPITMEDVENGVWRASVVGYQQTALNYVRALNVKGKTNFVWPEHTIESTNGAAIYPIVSDSLLRWERKYNTVDKIFKGMCRTTEMFGAFEAEIPDINDPSTQMNMDAISKFMSADEILIAGEALGFCVAETVKQLATRYVSPTKFILLSDCTSNVPSFEFLGDAFVKELTEKGMRVMKSTEIV